MEPGVKVSHLLRLPAELRNLIYYELLVSRQRSAESEVYRLANGHLVPPLLRTCRQLRNECMGMWCDNTIFLFSDPKLCVALLSRLKEEHVELIREMRYDTSETCTSPTSWRTAFRQLPGLDENTKLENLRAELATRGINLKPGVLKTRITIACRPSWTSDPLAAASDAIKQGG